jgi:hypothetical protein
MSMRNGGLVRGWMTLAGIALVAAGLLGFIENPLVGNSAGALIPGDSIQTIVRLFTGLLALYIAFRLRGQNQVSAALGFGILYGVIFLAVLISPNLLGFFRDPATPILNVIHAVLAAVSLGIGYIARNSAPSYSG